MADARAIDGRADDRRHRRSASADAAGRRACEATERAAFDPFEDGFTEWPYEQYARLREHDPVHHSDLMHGWMLTRFADVDRVLKDPAMSTDIDNATPTPNTRIEIERRRRDRLRSRTRCRCSTNRTTAASVG